MKQTTEKYVISRFGELEKVRQPWEGLWQLISDYVVPRRYDIQQNQSKGKKIGVDIYDGTALSALNLLADGLHGYLVSPAIQWFKLAFRDKKLNDIWEVKAWLQACAEIIYGEFANSNFYECMSEYFLDGGSIGTSTLYIEEDVHRNRLNFSCRHPGEIYLAEDHFGLVDTVYRKFKLSARQAVQRFGNKVGPEILAMNEKQPEQQYEFIHAVFPRSDRNTTMKDNRNMPFASVYILKDKGTLIAESGYQQNPYCVWRWKKNSNEVYGRSPANDALVDILKLNKMSKDLLWAAQMSADPPLNVPAEMKNKVRIKPHGFNYYDRADRLVTPVHTGINFPIGVDREERTQKIIEEHFRVEFFLMLARAEREMTATEVLEKSGEKAAVLGTTIGRLNTECLNPVFDRVFAILTDAGKIPEPPGVVMESGQERLEVDYLGPLAQAQRRLFRTQGIASALERAAPLVAISPESIDVLDGDEAMREIMDASGAPVDTIRSREAVEEIRAKRQQAQEQEAQMQATERGAGVTKQLAQADKLTDGGLSQATAEEQLSEAIPS